MLQFFATFWFASSGALFQNITAAKQESKQKKIEDPGYFFYLFYVVQNEQFNIYPDPTSNYFLTNDINSLLYKEDLLQVIITDMTGNIILSLYTKENESIHITQLPPGLYFVNIHCGANKKEVRKLIKKK